MEYLAPCPVPTDSIELIMLVWFVAVVALVVVTWRLFPPSSEPKEKGIDS